MDWQQTTALTIAAAAFLWLVRRTFFARGQKGACGGCGTCSHAVRPTSSPQLVPLDALREQPQGRPLGPAHPAFVEGKAGREGFS